MGNIVNFKIKEGRLIKAEIKDEALPIFNFNSDEPYDDDMNEDIYIASLEIPDNVTVIGYSENEQAYDGSVFDINSLQYNYS